MKFIIVLVAFLSFLFGFNSEDYKITKNGEIKNKKDGTFLCVEYKNKFTRTENKVQVIFEIDDGISPDTLFHPSHLGLGMIKDGKVTHYKFDATDNIKIYIIPYKRELILNENKSFANVTPEMNRICHDNSISTQEIRADKKRLSKKEKLKSEKVRKEKLKRDKTKKEKLKRDKTKKEKLKRDKAKKEKLKQDKAKKEKLKRDKAKKEKLKQDKAKKEKLKRDKAKKEKLKQDKAKKEKLKQDKAKKEKLKQDLIVYIKVGSTIDSKKQQRIVKQLNQYIHNPKYGNVYLTFSEKYRDVKYEGNDSSLYHLYKADNASVRRDRNYEFDIPALLETDTKRYKDIIVFDYLTSCRNNYAKNVTIVNIDNNTCDKKSEDRIIDLMSSNK